MKIRLQWVTPREDCRKAHSKKHTIESSCRHSRKRRGGSMLRNKICSERKTRRQQSGRIGTSRYLEITKRSSTTSEMLTAHIKHRSVKMRS